MKHPIDSVQRVEVEKLSSNDYNPNVVMNDELNLLKFSILKSGRIQPILVDEKYTIIDGFHRFSLCKWDEQVRALTDWKVPVVIMKLTVPERMMLTIRINRAKGSHIAFKMSDIIKSLVEEHWISKKDIEKNIGAKKGEVELLLMNDVFKKKDTQNHKYSKAWYPK